MDTGQSSLHPFVRLSREDWARLPADASFALSEEVRSIGAHLSPEEARQAYLPLSRLLYLHVGATKSLYPGQPARSWPKRRRKCPTSLASLAA